MLSTQRLRHLWSLAATHIHAAKACHSSLGALYTDHESHLTTMSQLIRVTIHFPYCCCAAELETHYRDRYDAKCASNELEHLNHDAETGRYHADSWDICEGCLTKLTKAVRQMTSSWACGTTKGATPVSEA